MKKIKLFIIPLIAMLPLASCGGSDAKPKTYNVTIGESDQLSFLTIDDKPLGDTKATEKKDFTFKMVADDDPSDMFIVPDTLNITVGEEVITDYEIAIKEGNTEAEVTIKGNEIIGDINISGQADIVNGYRYKAPYLYGVTAELGEGIHIKGDVGLTIKFEAEADFSAPNAENIYIELDNFKGQKVWFSPAEGFDSICTYDDTTGELTIEPGADEYIESNVVIIARASDYNLLETASWDEISEASTEGIAEDLYYLGEEKTVNIYGKEHKVRIIGFDRDVDAEGNKLGITFEFVNLINAGAIKWGNNNTNFINSSLDVKLNGDNDGTVLSELKKDDAQGLGNFIKSVRKKVNVKESSSWVNKSYDTYLFPLTYAEMGKDDRSNERYAYYNDATGKEHEKRKKALPGGVSSDYWTRSPRLAGDGKNVMYFTGSGGVSDTTPSKEKYFAPAFCI